MKDNIDKLQNDSFERTRAWLEDELARKTTLSPNITKLIFVGLINRTNTGALSTALGRTPIDPPIVRHIQPFKALARQIMESKGVQASTPLTFFKDSIEISEGNHLVKETIGPNIQNPAEWIDAMNIILSKGLDPKKMVFIPTFRDPLDTVASWKRMWKWEWKDFPYDAFNKSFSIVSEKISVAENSGIKVVPYVHEFLRDFDRFEVIERMFKQIDIPYSHDVVNWDGSDKDTDWYFEGPIVKYDQPPDDWVRGALSITKGGRGGLEWRPINNNWQLTQEERLFVTNQIGSAIEVYNHHVAKAHILLGFDQSMQEV